MLGKRFIRVVNANERWALATGVGILLVVLPFTFVSVWFMWALVPGVLCIGRAQDIPVIREMNKIKSEKLQRELGGHNGW
jgi:hypothetical protein